MQSKEKLRGALISKMKAHHQMWRFLVSCSYFKYFISRLYSTIFTRHSVFFDCRHKNSRIITEMWVINTAADVEAEAWGV
jgi:hypothetical protein